MIYDLGIRICSVPISKRRIPNFGFEILEISGFRKVAGAKVGGFGIAASGRFPVIFVVDMGERQSQFQPSHQMTSL
jgi:hypothetical protein